MRCPSSLIAAVLLSAAVTAHAWGTKPADAPSPLPSPTSAAPQSVPDGTCVGDCYLRGHVDVLDLPRCVEVFKTSPHIEVCPAADRNRDGKVTIDETQSCINNWLATALGTTSLCDTVRPATP